MSNNSAIAIEACNWVIANAPATNKPLRARALMRIGTLLIEKREYDAALKHLTEAAEIDPFSGELFFRKGNANYHLRRYDAAIADYSRSIDLNSTSPEAWGNRCGARKDKGERELAIADCKRALSIDPSLEYVKKSLAELLK